MKLLSFALVVFVSLASCGKVEKKPSPFEKIGNEDSSSDKKAAQFKTLCSRRNGTLLKENTICFVINDGNKLEKTAEKLAEDIGNNGFVVYSLGTIREGAVIGASSSEGASTLSVFVSGIKIFETSPKGTMDRVLTNRRGEITVQVFKGTKLGAIFAFVGTCFGDGEPWVPCPQP